jgi:2-polyprenyl-3-methyl-5-hydroxy-6-metoxy-1,4-benzoquinol methylase
MYKDNGFRRMLSVPWIYEQFQNLTGAVQARRWMAENYWRLKGGEKVVDVGCGPGVIFNSLPKGITYLGFDISERYIRKAQELYGTQATFLVSSVGELLKKPDERFKNADLVICNGLLHHLSDEESLEVLHFAYMALKPGGRLVCEEPSFLIKQHWPSRFVMGLDRGNHVRNEREWKALVGQVFKTFTTDISTAQTYIPYVHIIIECRK